MIPKNDQNNALSPENSFDTWELDKAKKASLLTKIDSLGLLQRMRNSLWLVCDRLLYRLKQSGQLDKSTGLVADAITSRQANSKRTHDGGREGWFRQMKAFFNQKLNHSPNSLEKADQILEYLGVIKKHHNGAGLVAHIEVCTRSLVLLLEALHPEWDEIPQCFKWLKSVCDGILGRPFNRTDWENGDGVDFANIDEKIEEYDQRFPLQAIAIDALDWLWQKSFYRFCVRKVAEYAERFGVGFMVDDYWLDIGDPCCE